MTKTLKKSNLFFKAKKQTKSYKRKGATYVGRKHKYLGMIKKLSKRGGECRKNRSKQGLRNKYLIANKMHGGMEGPSQARATHSSFYDNIATLLEKWGVIHGSKFRDLYKEQFGSEIRIGPHENLRKVLQKAADKGYCEIEMRETAGAPSMWIKKAPARLPPKCKWNCPEGDTSPTGVCGCAARLDLKHHPEMALPNFNSMDK